MGDCFFSNPSYNTIGEPYAESKSFPFKHGNKKNVRQFASAPPRRGQTGNAIGYGPLEYKSMWGAEPYEEMHKVHAKVRQQGKAGFKTSRGFVCASPMKKSSTPGDTSGTFQGRVEHFQPGEDENRKDNKGSDMGAARNVYTSPSARGGYGVPHTLIGGGEFSYMPSYYDANDEKRKKELRQHRMAQGERRAFTSATRHKKYFDVNEHCDAQKIYSTKGLVFTDKPEKQPEGSNGLIFRPSSPAKRGPRGTINVFPEAMCEPFDEKVLNKARNAERVQPQRDLVLLLPPNLRGRKPFRPTSGYRSSATRPMSTMGLRACKC